MTARPVLLTADEHAEVERLDFEAESPTARRQYLAELVVLRGLVTAARAKSMPKIERALQRILRPSLTLQRDTQSEPPAVGSERLL